MASTDSSTTKQRKKRKWDQPAESLASAGMAVPGILPLGNMGFFAGIPFPGVAPGSAASLMNPLTATCATLPQVFQMPSIQQHVAAIVQKVNQPKIQDELIAREIVINDAESAVRYKLTKRQTQEEIQKCTGAVVTTRGKYRPPNSLPDGEKPLYLHISAGAHMETTVERIKAVDHAATMVEEMLRLGSVNNGVQPLSTCVYLGFEADSSLNIAARIRGPNDQYVNHIMNETRATVLLRGRGSGNAESAFGEEGQQLLHLFLSSNNLKSLEQAKFLAENLLDTISTECGASRVSSCKVYGAVPPPQQLLAGVQSSGNESTTNSLTAAGSKSSSDGSASVLSSVTGPCVTTVFSQVTVPQPLGLVNHEQSHPNIASYSQPSLTGGTSYNGYGGIFPQATPLQQVALVLRQSTSQVTSIVAPTTTAASAESNSSMGSFCDKQRRPPQKRKFQELPVTSKETAKAHQNSLQDSEFRKPHEATSDLGVRSISTMPAPKKLVLSSTIGMPTPPARTMPLRPVRTMPPPLPKFNSSTPVLKVREDRNIVNTSKAETVSDTLVKLMEYGDEDEYEDLEETSEQPIRGNSNTPAAPKPFWAV